MLRSAIRRLIEWAMTPTPEEHERSQRAFDTAMSLMVAHARELAEQDRPEIKLH